MADHRFCVNYLTAIETVLVIFKTEPQKIWIFWVILHISPKTDSYLFTLSILVQYIGGSGGGGGGGRGLFSTFGDFIIYLLFLNNLSVKITSQPHSFNFVTFLTCSVSSS